MEKDKKLDHILDFRRAHFNFFRGLLGRMSWDMALEKRVQESWLITSSKLKTDPSQQVGNQTEVAEGLNEEGRRP